MQELDRAGQAKAAMFPQAHPSGSSRDPQDPSHHLYVTSHGAYGAGEQRHRHYDWDRTGLDPATHSFGEALPAASHVSGILLFCSRVSDMLMFGYDLDSRMIWKLPWSAEASEAHFTHSSLSFFLAFCFKQTSPSVHLSERAHFSW